jgi:hypothetical protein
MMPSHQPGSLSRLGFLLGSLLTAACASAAQSGVGQEGGQRSSSVVTAEELAAQPMNNLYDALQRLRPRWLVERGTTTLGTGGNPVVVYLDNQRMGGVEELRNILLQTVHQVRYRDAADATTRYGTGHASGAIEITTKRR